MTRFCYFEAHVNSLSWAMQVEYILPYLKRNDIEELMPYSKEIEENVQITEIREYYHYSIQMSTGKLQFIVIKKLF